VKYTVVLHRDEDEGGYWVEVPALPGCASQGETIEEALENVKEAIELFVSALEEDGAKVPRDEEIVYVVTVAA
jgi:predicted RNase H-like HicB family nuclease